MKLFVNWEKCHISTVFTGPVIQFHMYFQQPTTRSFRNLVGRKLRGFCLSKQRDKRRELELDVLQLWKCMIWISILGLMVWSIWFFLHGIHQSLIFPPVFYFFCVFAICFVQLFFSANPLKSTPEKINQTKQNTCTPKLVLCFWQLGGRCSHCCPWNLLRSWFLIYLLNKKLVQETMRLACQL